MLQEFRCFWCGKLLAKVSDKAVVEIKCIRCKHINLNSNKSPYLGKRDAQST